MSIITSLDQALYTAPRVSINKHFELQLAGEDGSVISTLSILEGSFALTYGMTESAEKPLFHVFDGKDMERDIFTPCFKLHQWHGQQGDSGIHAFNFSQNSEETGDMSHSADLNGIGTVVLTDISTDPTIPIVIPIPGTNSTQEPEAEKPIWKVKFPFRYDLRMYRLPKNKDQHISVVTENEPGGEEEQPEPQCSVINRWQVFNNFRMGQRKDGSGFDAIILETHWVPWPNGDPLPKLRICADPRQAQVQMKAML